GGVRPGGRRAAVGVHLRLGRLPLPNLAGLDHALVHARPARPGARVPDPDHASRRPDGPGVPDLAPALGVEGRAVHDDPDRLAPPRAEWRAVRSSTTRTASPSEAPSRAPSSSTRPTTRPSAARRS